MYACACVHACVRVRERDWGGGAEKLFSRIWILEHSIGFSFLSLLFCWLIWVSQRTKKLWQYAFSALIINLGFSFRAFLPCTLSQCENQYSIVKQHDRWMEKVRWKSVHCNQAMNSSHRPFEYWLLSKNNIQETSPAATRSSMFYHECHAFKITSLIKHLDICRWGLLPWVVNLNMGTRYCSG
jgi:hypothetical protein